MRAASAVLGVLLLSTVCGVVSAQGDEALIAVHLDLKSSADCASSADLIARVQARSPRIRFVDDASAPTVRATFATLPSGEVVGEVVLDAPGAKVPHRRLHSSSCADAVDAVALVIAIGLDPSAAPQSPVIASDEAPVPSGDAERAPPAQNPTRPTRPTEVRRTHRPSPPPPHVADRPVATRARFGAALAGQALVGPIPGVMPGIVVSATAGLDREALWSPAIVLGAQHSWRSDLRERGGTASFMFDGASLDACAARAHSNGFEARACAATLVGRLSARGSDTVDPSERARLFAVAGVATVLTFRIHPIVELSGRLGAGLTLVRDAYEFSPAVFYTAAPVTVSASLGLGIRSP